VDHPALARASLFKKVLENVPSNEVIRVTLTLEKYHMFFQLKINSDYPTDS
jgi:hypothetical protein